MEMDGNLLFTNTSTASEWGLQKGERGDRKKRGSLGNARSWVSNLLPAALATMSLTTGGRARGSHSGDNSPLQSSSSNKIGESSVSNHECISCGTSRGKRSEGGEGMSSLKVKLSHSLTSREIETAESLCGVDPTRRYSTERASVTEGSAASPARREEAARRSGEKRASGQRAEGGSAER